MSNNINSPKITRLNWGRLEVEGGQVFKDAKLFPGGAREWDWRETGTRHAPGIQIADVRELLEQDATVIILSKGINERLQVCPETLQYLRDRDIPVHVLETQEAAELYNELRKEKPVGGLFHSTC